MPAATSSITSSTACRSGRKSITRTATQAGSTVSTARSRPSSGPHLTRTLHTILVARELFDADRSSGVKAVRRDTNLGAHAELTAVGKLSRGVMQHDGAVDAGEKALGSCLIGGDDRLGMRRAIVRDMSYRLIDPLDHAHGNDRIEEFSEPVGLARRLDARVGGLRALIAAHLAAGGNEIRNQRLEVGRRAGAIHQQRLGRAADPGTPHF